MGFLSKSSSITLSFWNGNVRSKDLVDISFAVSIFLPRIPSGVRGFLRSLKKRKKELNAWELKTDMMVWTA